MKVLKGVPVTATSLVQEPAVMVQPAELPSKKTVAPLTFALTWNHPLPPPIGWRVGMTVGSVVGTGIIFSVASTEDCSPALTVMLVE